MIRINITITEPLLTRLDAEVNFHETSRSELLRTILQERYNRMPKQGFGSLTKEELKRWQDD